MARENYVRFDWATKRLLRQKSNFVILEGFLSTLLGERIKIDRMLESEGNQQHAEDKFNRVDMLAENSKGELVIIVCCMEYQRLLPNTSRKENPTRKLKKYTP